MSGPDIRKTMDDLERDEAYRAKAYRCTAGKITVGIGRNIDPSGGKGISYSEARTLLANDVTECIDDLEKLPAVWNAVKDDEVRARALINMRFQLGGTTFRGFKNSLALIAKKDWKGAAANLRQSKWAKQDTPARAERVIKMIETGRG